MKKFTIFFLVLLGIFIVIGLFLPTEYAVTRTQVIKSKPVAIHAHVNDLTKWEEWAPWKDEDPTLAVTLGEIKSGVGASQSWVGKNGDGSLTVTMSSEQEGIDYDLSFSDGEYEGTAFIHYQDNGEKTEVTWTMEGDMAVPVVGGYLALSMDSTVGPMLQRGLTKLKNTVESIKKPPEK